MLAVLVAPSCSRDGSQDVGTTAPPGTSARHARRPPWTTSRVVGSPEPPPPYSAVPAYPRLTFDKPLLVVPLPGTDRLVVGEKQGKIFSFRDDPDAGTADLFADLRAEVKSFDPEGPETGFDTLFGLAFHPRFEEQRYAYLAYAVNSKHAVELQEGTRLSRVAVTRDDPPRLDLGTEQILLAWRVSSHNGGCLQFGPDGYLYVSTGDGSDSNPPDVHLSGQSLSDIQSSILRIDVDRPSPGLPYSIPADNPFVDFVGARGEIWAYGLRNPWRMSFDRSTGDLWVGDVGWESFEMVHRVVRGGNYGWSVMEGPQPVRADAQRGPTPILPPVIALPRSVAASVIGGYVYRGSRLPELTGKYVFGDHESLRLWAADWDGERVSRLTDLIDPGPRIVSFGELRDGELLVVDHAGGRLLRLEPKAAPADQPPFPRKLSETGLFASTADERPAAGVIPFSILSKQWVDFATAERWIAIPGEGSVRVRGPSITAAGESLYSRLQFPPGTVLAKTISMEMQRTNPASRRRLETQILHYERGIWSGYTYAWNAAQTDAELVDARGAEETLVVADRLAPRGERRQVWKYHGRAECIRCHNRWARDTLAFTIPQLARRVDRDGRLVDQIEALLDLGVLAPAAGGWFEGDAAPSADIQGLSRLVDPTDSSAPLARRARSYLQANCAHCHQYGAGSAAEFDLRWELPIEDTKTLDSKPLQGTFGIHDGQIVASGDPYRSVLYYRMSKQGRGRMPQVGSEIPDRTALDLMDEWIRSLPARHGDADKIARLAALDENVARQLDRTEAEIWIPAAARQLARRAQRQEAGPEDLEAARILREQAEVRLRAARVVERARIVDELLGSTSRAMLLARAVEDGDLPEPIRRQVLREAKSRPEPWVRDLFGKFYPAAETAVRLGSVVDTQKVLGIQGDVERGRRVFFDADQVSCKTCHRIGDEGGLVGPDLSRIGATSSLPQILESVLEPSKTIDPKYASYSLETVDGRILIGLLVERTPSEVVLRNPSDEVVRISTAEIETIAPQSTSLMPDLQTRDLTEQQVADLLSFLAAQKRE